MEKKRKKPTINTNTSERKKICNGSSINSIHSMIHVSNSKMYVREWLYENVVHMALFVKWEFKEKKTIQLIHSDTHTNERNKKKKETLLLIFNVQPLKVSRLRIFFSLYLLLQLFALCHSALSDLRSPLSALGGS